MSKKPIVLHDLHSSDYEHPFDRKALDALEGTPGLDFLTRKVLKIRLDRVYRIQHTGSNIKVGTDCLPDLHREFLRVSDTLNCGHAPELYLTWQYALNAYATGIDIPMVVLYSGCVDLLEPDERAYIMGHEMGHIKSNHILYHQMAQILPNIGRVVGHVTLGLGSLLSGGLQLALLNWYRMSEFTADRAGLLACQNPDATMRSIVKMAGLPIQKFGSGIEEAFVKQAKEFDEYDYDSLNKVIKIYSVMDRTHPWTVMRAAELLKWIDSGGYDAVLKRCEKETKPVEKGMPVCSECGVQISEMQKFCGGCGAMLDALKKGASNVS